MSLLDKPLLVATALVYLAIVLGIGLWSARRTRTSRDFFIAGQRIGLTVTGLATMSAGVSGFIFVGGPGLTYRLGIASLWIVLPVGFTAAMLCWVVAKPLRLLAEVREVYTLPDVVRCRFDSPAAAGLAALAVLVGVIAYLGSQLLALAAVLQAFGVQRLAWALAVALLVLLVYSVVGGMVAGVYTDVVQGALMLVSAVAVFAYALHTAGGFGELTRSISASPDFGPSFLDPLGGVPIFTVFGFFFVFGIGVLGQPQMLHKFFMLDDVRKLRFMPIVLGGSQSVCMLIWVGIGLAVPALVAQSRMSPPARPDLAAPAFLLGHTPEILAGTVFAGILAAVMSTADSFLNIGSAALVRDLPRALGRPLRNELSRARQAVPVIAALAGLLAWLYEDLVALLGTLAFGTFAAALAPAIAIGLNWRRVTRQAAVASIAVGLLVTPTLEFLSKQAFIPWLPRPPLAAGVLPSAFALALSFATLFLVTWWTTRTGEEPLAEDVERVLEA